MLTYTRTCAYCMHVFTAKGKSHKQALAALERKMNEHYQVCKHIPKWLR